MGSRWTGAHSSSLWVRARCPCRPIRLSASATGWKLAGGRLAAGRRRGGGRGGAPAGLASAEHPLLGASIPVAEGDSFVFTGRLSLATHAWLAGHVVFGAVLLPGTTFVELALAAAQRVGLDRVEELTNEAPLVVPERGAGQSQLLIG